MQIAKPKTFYIAVYFYQGVATLLLMTDSHNLAVVMAMTSKADSWRRNYESRWLSDEV